MDGGTKKIIIVAIAAVLVISSLGVIASLRKEAERENPKNVIASGLNVGNPVAFLDKNGDGKADYAEGNFEVSDSSARSLVYGNSDTPEPLKVSENNNVNVPHPESEEQSKMLAEEQSGGNMSLVHAPKLNISKQINTTFIGFRGIHVDLKHHRVAMNASLFISRAKYGIPAPDLMWIKNASKRTYRIFPGLEFGKNGFNATDMNFTSIQRITSIDKNHDGNPEYYKIVEYSNLTQDINGDGTPDVQIIRYHMMMYYDNNSDGTPEFKKWITIFAYLQDVNHDGYFEKKVVLASGGYVKYNGSTPIRFKAYAIGNETVDMNEDHQYEFHLTMLGFVDKYNNGTTANWTFVRAMFGVHLISMASPEHPAVNAATLTGYVMRDKNGDSHPEMEKFLHWRYVKVSKNGSKNYNFVRGTAAYAVYYDNNSNGIPEYQLIGIKGISYHDMNQNGRPENGIKGFAYWKEGSDDSTHPKSVVFRLGIVNGTDENENGIYEKARKLYIGYNYYDNNSDGNPEYVHMLVAGWSIYDPEENKHYKHAAVLWDQFTMKDNNSDGNPEFISNRLFFREVWTPRSDGTYGAERGIASIRYAYDNNSNGVFDNGARKVFGYIAYRNGTGKNFTSVRLVCLNANFSNPDDNGTPEFQNLTVKVVQKSVTNGTTSLHVWITTHHVYLKYNSTANQTWLYNVTFKGVYKETKNATGKSWSLRGVLIVKIDYDRDGTWDYTQSTIVNRSGH